MAIFNLFQSFISCYWSLIGNILLILFNNQSLLIDFFDQGKILGLNEMMTEPYQKK